MHSALYDRMLDTQQFSYFSFHSFLNLPFGVFFCLAVCMSIIRFAAAPAKRSVVEQLGSQPFTCRAILPDALH